jgi:hypothetical protein
VLGDWQGFYRPPSTSGDAAACQLCHVETNGGEPFNAYGWDILLALEDDFCDLSEPPDGVDNLEAFMCVELEDSDSDLAASDNLTEIDASTQPGWTHGESNTYHSTTAPPLVNQPPPDDIGPLDPGDCPREDTIRPDQFGEGTITVEEGQSIQEAIDRAEEGTRILIEVGEYKEPCNPLNGLNITKNGIQLIGQSTAAAGPTSPDEERVIVKSTRNQRNGIVIVPPVVPLAAQPKGANSAEVVRTDCMGCHTDLAPPFPLHPNVPKIIPKEDEPWLSDIVIQGITIQGFSNNGLFTEHVEGFEFIDVETGLRQRGSPCCAARGLYCSGDACVGVS